MDLKVVKVNKNNYTKYSNQIINLIKEAFTSGHYSQQLLKREYVSGYIKDLFEKESYGYLFINKLKVVGLVILSPNYINFSHLKSVKKNLDLSRCLSLLELAVSEKYQKIGIGSVLLKKAINSVDKSKYNQIILKALVKNKPALELYKKFGFKESVIVKEKGTNKDGKSFLMAKKYLIKTL